MTNPRNKLIGELQMFRLRGLQADSGEGQADVNKMLAAIDSYCASSTPDGEVVVGDKDGNMAGWHIIKWRDGLPPLALGTKVYLKEST